MSYLVAERNSAEVACWNLGGLSRVSQDQWSDRDVSSKTPRPVHYSISGNLAELAGYSVGYRVGSVNPY